MMLWPFGVEFKEMSFDGFSGLSFGRVLIRRSDEAGLADPCSPGDILVVPKLPDIGALRPLLECQTSKLIPCTWIQDASMTP